jgi:hypothetical protein
MWISFWNYMVRTALASLSVGLTWFREDGQYYALLAAVSIYMYVNHIVQWKDIGLTWRWRRGFLHSVFLPVSTVYMLTWLLISSRLVLPSCSIINWDFVPSWRYLTPFLVWFNIDWFVVRRWTGAFGHHFCVFERHQSAADTVWSIQIF